MKNNVRNKRFSIVLCAILTACGSEVIERPADSKEEPGETSWFGPPSDETDLNNTLSPFVGEFYLPDSGYVAINQNYENEFDVDLRIDTRNPDNTICSLDLDGRGVDEHSDLIVYYGNVTLKQGNCQSDAGDDLETDNPDVKYIYRIKLEFHEDDLLSVELKVLENDKEKRKLVIDRTVAEEE